MTKVVRGLWPMVHGLTLDRDTLRNRKFAPYKVCTRSVIFSMHSVFTNCVSHLHTQRITAWTLCVQGFCRYTRHHAHVEIIVLTSTSSEHFPLRDVSGPVGLALCDRRDRAGCWHGRHACTNAGTVGMHARLLAEVWHRGLVRTFTGHIETANIWKPCPI